MEELADLSSQNQSVFFAVSRDNVNLEIAFRQFAFVPPECFIGEFCGFLFDSSTSHIIFGRDVFGRKSLCWRIGGDANESRKCTFELSLLPGQAQCDQEKAGWQEVPPGILFSIRLPNPTCYLRTNAMLKGKFTTVPVHDFYSEFDCTKDEFVRQKILVKSFYQQNHFMDNPIFQLFNAVDFNAIESDILLQPIPPQPTMPSTDVEIVTFTSQFTHKFFEVTRNILRPVIQATDDFGHLHVPVLFSGGVDSLMVALAAGDLLFQFFEKKGFTKFEGIIRLFTVAFGENEKECSETTDRAQSIIAFKHLRERSLEKYGTNPYKLIFIDVNKQELVECRRKVIADAIYPSKTVLDDSLGCVLWFATRMKGIEYLPDGGGMGGFISEDHAPFALVGSGSDEQLGGYARHRTCFEKKGLEGLAAELSMEMHRIGQRNFGRDDRVAMSNGRALMAPFLEEPLVRWLNKVPTAVKTGFSLPSSAGESNKFLLRNALRSLGLPEPVVARPKRAMQFGTGIAKMERIPGQKGADLCQRLLRETIDSNKEAN